MSHWTEDVGTFVRNRRVAMGMTSQGDLARKANLGIESVSRIERGLNTTTETLEAVAQALAIDVRMLCFGADGYAILDPSKGILLTKPEEQAWRHADPEHRRLALAILRAGASPDHDVLQERQQKERLRHVEVGPYVGQQVIVLGRDGTETPYVITDKSLAIPSIKVRAASKSDPNQLQSRAEKELYAVWDLDELREKLKENPSQHGPWRLVPLKSIQEGHTAGEIAVPTVGQIENARRRETRQADAAAKRRRKSPRK